MPLDLIHLCMCFGHAVQHSELQRLLPDNKHEVLIQRGQVTGAALMAAQRAAKGGDGLMLALDEGAKWGAAKVSFAADMAEL